MVYNACSNHRDQCFPTQQSNPITKSCEYCPNKLGQSCQRQKTQALQQYWEGTAEERKFEFD